MGSPRLHVVCGGGTGSQLLRKLHARGYRLSAGPLSEIDDDARTANSLGVEVALLPQDARPGADGLARVRELLRSAEGVIVTPFAVGRGNLTSLIVVTELPRETLLYLVVGGEFGRRDYTGGEATRLYDLLRTRAAALAPTASELLPILTRRIPVGSADSSC